MGKGVLSGTLPFKEKEQYSKTNFTYLVSLDLHKHIGDIIFDGWPCFVCISRSFCRRNSRHYHCRCPVPTSATDGRGLINDISQRVSGSTTHSFSIERADWFKGAAVKLHCYVTIATSAVKIRWCCWSFKGDLPCLRKEIRYQEAVQTWRNGCKFKGEGLKILDRQDSSWLMDQ